jgi:hypothetical protein
VNADVSAEGEPLVERLQPAVDGFIRARPDQSEILGPRRTGGQTHHCKDRDAEDAVMYD